MRIFTPSNWYWIVSGSSTQVYSSAAGNYVPVTDPTYQQWLQNSKPSAIDSEASLGIFLAAYSLRPTPPGILSGYVAALAGGVNSAVLRILFNHENRIRTLEGKANITVQQFITGVQALL